MTPTRSRQYLDKVFEFHALASILLGFLTVLTPHSLGASIVGDYGHAVHEFLRLYGVLTLGQGWMVWQTRKVSDAFVRKTFCQAYCLCFGLQALVLFRAQISSPKDHSWLNYVVILLFVALSGLYGNFLLKPMKTFSLPGGPKEMI